MSVSYELRNYWCASRMVCRLSPRVAARYLAPRIVWAVTQREKALLERLRDQALRADHSAMTEANVLPLQRSEPPSVA
ncbi:hypothetical protein [Acuticoccus sp. I52.16.1]|uniref:hypothetical protein n=1 Tax=Acuticoccus sp. I52.16.1 TaxID=2928472 RepID=UPI001FD52331|nr:hypothetical protein [Acuticoccus sp. I52.16.1]UOM35167.1 hypothetical protein MRB58_02845 [Acuticoccus sp. I52.16.1]